jgi:integrase
MTRRGPGEGSIYQRGDGRWAGSVHIGYENGRRIRKHVLGHSRAEVKDKLTTVQRLQAEQRPIPDLRIKVGPYLRQWLDEVARPRVRASTLKSYREIVEGHLVPELGNIPIAKLTPAEVQAFLNRKQASDLSARRVQYIHAVLRRALVTAERWGLVSRNVARLVDPPRVRRREITPLTPEQARRLIETSVEDRYRALWITALGTGLRQGELLALRWEDVDLTAGRLWVRHTLANVDGTLTLLEPKTDRSRRLVVLPAPVCVALRAHRTRQKMDRVVAGSHWVDSGHVFATMLGKPHHAATISRAFDQALARAELPHTRFHDLRHSAATFLLSQGFGLEDVKNLLGHSTIVLTSNTYGHVLEQRQQEMARGMDAVLGG